MAYQPHREPDDKEASNPGWWTLRSLENYDYNPDDLLLTVEEFAVLAGRSYDRICQWISSNKVRSISRKHRTFIPASELNNVTTRSG